MGFEVKVNFEQTQWIKSLDETALKRPAWSRGMGITHKSQLFHSENLSREEMAILCLSIDLETKYPKGYRKLIPEMRFDRVFQENGQR